MNQEKRRVYERQADVIKAVSHPVRVGIIDFLRDGEQCVCDIADYVGSERSNVSRHLAVMLSAGVVEYRKEGLNVMYRLRTPCILRFFECITECLRERARQEAGFMQTLRQGN